VAATASIPVYLSVGNGSAVEIGQIKLSLDGKGRATLTTFDIAAALREAADELEKAAREAEQQTADDGEGVDGAAP
jgi:hypothetical protein